MYSYNGVVLPKSPYNDDSLSVIGVKDGVFYAVGYFLLPSRILIDVSGADCYVLLNGEWVIPSIGYIEDIQIIWTSQDIVSLDGDLLLAGSQPVVTLVETPVNYSDFAVVINAFTGQISVRLVVTVLAGAAGVSIGLVFLWWGSRKVTGALIKALKKGKLRI